MHRPGLTQGNMLNPSWDGGMGGGGFGGGSAGTSYYYGTGIGQPVPGESYGNTNNSLIYFNEKINRFTYF